MKGLLTVIGFFIGWTLGRIAWLALKLYAGYYLIMRAIAVYHGYTPGVWEAVWWVVVVLFLFKGSLAFSD